MQITATTAQFDPEYADEVHGVAWTMSHGRLRHYRWCPDRRKVVNRFSLAEMVWRVRFGVTVKRFQHLNGDPLDCRIENLRPFLGVQEAVLAASQAHDARRSSCRGGLHAASRTQDRLPEQASPPPERPLLSACEAQEVLDERAAIMQFDGGLSEDAAMASALEELLRAYSPE